MSCDKVSLRREMIEKRKRLNIVNGEGFTDKIKALEEFKRAKNVMIYMPVKGECDITGLICDEKVFLLPITKGEDMYPSVLGELEEGDFNVPVPRDKTPFDKSEIDIVIVPGVAFDKEFNRMGFGKGYYDRFLKDMSTVKIGVCHSFQLLDRIPFDEHDVKMDIIVTEDSIWRKENT